MWRIVLQVLKVGGPAAIGFLSNDLLAWFQQVPVIGDFFKRKDSSGNTPTIVIVAAYLLALVIFFLILSKVFKVKIFKS